MIESRLCTQKDFETEWFKKITKDINCDFRYHRKLWEFVVMIDTLHKLNLLKEGRVGLGFAVGTEPLTSYFIKHGCKVVASDYMDQELWSKNNELAQSLKDLNTHKIIDQKVLESNCIFRNVDMRNIPEDLKQEQFDFIWSSCAFEHLGNLEEGKKFVVDSLKCLKPGGYAIHTSEYNCSSNDDTVKEGDFVVYRKQDYEDIEYRLKKNNAKLFPINYDLGDMEHDSYVDDVPYESEIHLKLNLVKYTSTSILLIIQKGF